MTDHCPTCGAAVRIEASGVTHYMVPIDAERVRELEERIRELEAALAHIRDEAHGLDTYLYDVACEALEGKP